jgi:vitamin B12 transporter
MVRKSLIPIASLLLAPPVAAQSAEPGGVDLRAPAPAEPLVTILVNGSRQTIENSGYAVSVFDRAAIEQVQGADLTRLLERAPGVTLSRNGGPGGFTGVRVRGAEADQVLVLVDEVRVADVAAPGGGFDFGNLLLGNLAKVEVLRGSNSTIWGSQALGGVLAVTTGSPSHYASAEYGGPASRYATVGVGLDLGPAAVQLAGGHFASDGSSAAAAGTEPDGFRQTEFAGRVTVALGAGLSAFATGRLADGRVELDGFPAPAYALADTAEYQDTRQVSAAAGIAYAGPDLSLRAVASRADTERANYDPAVGPDPGYTTDGSSERVELRGRWRAGRGVTLHFGAERESLRFATLFDPVRRTASAGTYAQADYDAGPLHLSAGLRRDAHRDFGGTWSFGADVALRLRPGLRAVAAFGEGFKAPTLFQLRSDYGNAALRPERAASYDAGLEATQAWDAGRARFKLTAFRRDTRDLIGFVSCFGVTDGLCAGRPFGTYDNIGRARARGIELEGEVHLARPGLTASVALTQLAATDRTLASPTFGKALARRPERALTLAADWTGLGALSLGADLRVVSASFDDPANLTRLSGYAVMTLRAALDVGGPVSLYARVENVWDERYQTAAGYATPGRGGYLGARVKL